MLSKIQFSMHTFFCIFLTLSDYFLGIKKLSFAHIKIAKNNKIESNFFSHPTWKKKAENEILIKFFLPSDMEIFLFLLTMYKKTTFRTIKVHLQLREWIFLISGFIPKRIKRLDFQFSLFAMVPSLMQFVHWMMMCLMVYHHVYPLKSQKSFQSSPSEKKRHKSKFCVPSEMRWSCELQNLAAVATVMNEMDMRNGDNRVMFHFKRDAIFDCRTGT